MIEISEAVEGYLSESLRSSAEAGGATAEQDPLRGYSQAVNETWTSEIGPWFERNTVTQPGPAPHEIAALLGGSGTSVTVCLPTLNEATTVGPICETIRTELMGAHRVVDQLLVVDSGSEDGTPEVAAKAGAEVHLAADLPPTPALGGPLAGKGEALWKSLAVARGDLLVWIDSDIRNFSATFVTSLLGPLLTNDEAVMSKAFYERPLETPAGFEVKEGARVTELAARPLIQLLYPRLAGIIQPLSGEYAVRREAIMQLPFVTGYGVDVGLLIDVVERFGLDALFQADIGVRLHRNRDLATLGRMSFQVMQAILMRVRAAGHLDPGSSPTHLVQFLHESLATPVHMDLEIGERPPMSEFLAAR